MIHANRIVTVGDQESIIDRPIVLYRGDREVEIEFTLVGNEFMFSEEGNVIKSVNASHGQLVLNTPSGEHMFSELAECHEGKVVFVVTKEMIDEFIEMGFYSFQIRLYDSAEMKSRVTIPPVLSGFDIRNPIAAEDETNIVDQGLVNYARVFKDQSNEELHTFDWTGAYNKTEWAHHDVITENKLNKIEDALYSINADAKKFDTEMRNTLDQVTKDADKYVKEHIAEVEADVAEFERNLNTDVQKFKIDTNAAMTTHKNEVSEELESVNTQLVDIDTKINWVNPDDFEGDDSTKLTKSILYALENNKDVVLTRFFDITGLPPIIYNNSDTHKRVRIIGLSGGIRKNDSGFFFTTNNDYFAVGLSVKNVTFISNEGAGSCVYDGDKLYWVNSTNNNYINIDSVIKNTNTDLYIQCFRSISDFVRGGNGYAIDIYGAYDCSFENISIENRLGGGIRQTKIPDSLFSSSVNLRITNSVLESLGGTAIRIEDTSSVTISNVFLEANNGGHIFIGKTGYDVRCLEICNVTGGDTTNKTLITWMGNITSAISRNNYSSHGIIHDTTQIDTGYVESIGDFAHHRPNNDTNKRLLTKNNIIRYSSAEVDGNRWSKCLTNNGDYKRITLKKQVTINPGINNISIVAGEAINDSDIISIQSEQFTSIKLCSYMRNASNRNIIDATFENTGETSILCWIFVTVLNFIVEIG